MLTGRPPFDDENALEVLRKHIEEDPVPPARFNRRVKEDIQTVCLKCLEKDPDRRYQSADRLADDLRRFLAGDVITARPASVAYVVKRKLIRNKALFSVVTAAAALLVATSAWYVLGLRGQRNRARRELAARLALELEKEQAREAALRQAREAVQAGSSALERAGSAAGAEKERLLAEAQAAFRKSLFLAPGGEEARAGMRRASLTHFELALAAEAWGQAREKLEQARQVGLADDEYQRADARLESAQSARQRFIRERVEFLMNDARRTRREVLHELALSELISLKDPVTVGLLLPYVAHAGSACQSLAIESLGWMSDPRAVAAVLPYVGRVRPDGGDNPAVVQEAAFRAICILAPDEVRVYEALRARVYAEPDALNSAFYGRVRSYFERYASKMAPLAGPAPAAIPSPTPAPVPAGGEEQRLAREALDRGLRLYEAARYEEAIACFDQALRQVPDSVEALLQRGNARAKKGDIDGGIADFSAALRLTPDNQGARVNRGVLRTVRGDLHGALEDLDRAAALAPRDAAAFSQRGYVKRLMGDLDGALADFDRALALDPQLVDGYNRRGLTRRAAGDLAGAIRDFDRALELNPRAAEPYVNRGAVKAGMLDLAGAISDYDQAIKLMPGAWQSWVLRAAACGALDREEEYRKSLERAKELHPRPERVEPMVRRDVLGAKALLVGKSLEGRELTDPREMVVRGQYRLAVRRLEEARADIEKALEADPALGLRGGFAALTRIAGLGKDRAAGLAVRRRWAAAAPDDASVLNGLAWELLTCRARELRKPAEALKLARRAAELGGNADPMILDTLARALFENGRAAEAAAVQKKALDLLPAAAPAYERSRYARDLERYRKAVR
jgi:tetratricopeptide (TPR) repeat protein